METNQQLKPRYRVEYLLYEEVFWRFICQDQWPYKHQFEYNHYVKQIENGKFQFITKIS